jgi:hypothetical protein
MSGGRSDGVWLIDAFVEECVLPCEIVYCRKMNSIFTYQQLATHLLLSVV